MFRQLTKSSLFKFRSCQLLFRGIKTNVADLKKGDWIKHDGKYLVVQSVTSSHTGRGARHFLITTKEAVSSQVVAIKPNSRDDFEKLEMHDYPCQFMYENGDEFVLMNNKTFEEYSISSKLVDPNLAKLMEGGTQVKLRISDGQPVMVSAGPTLKCAVVGVLDVRESSDKKKSCIAVVQGGARINCSVQISPGDSIIVNTEDLSYSCRA